MTETDKPLVGKKGYRTMNHKFVSNPYFAKSICVICLKPPHKHEKGVLR